MHGIRRRARDLRRPDPKTSTPKPESIQTPSRLTRYAAGVGPDLESVMSAVVEQQQSLPMRAESVTPAQMLAIAVQQGADLQKLEKLMELQERWEANQARKSFDAAISAAKAEIKPVVKKREVDFPARNGGSRTNYKYEDLAAIADAVDPILSKYGLSYRHRAKQDGKLLTVTCILSHRDGHFEETTLFANNDESGNKNAIQSIGSAATYLQRYTLKLALGLAATKDDDARTTDNKPEPEIPAAPEGYEKWKADMTAKASDGYGAFKQSWQQASNKPFRLYADKYDTEWRNEIPKKAQEAGE